MGELIHLHNRPEYKAAMIAKLAEAEEQIATWTELAETYRQYLGNLAIMEQE